ncbi:sporulation integral membrane protein YtvI [Haloimpatiens sp. FM7315]|uniref:sporulation integral membrane protein YtvI n=1 Tax=Haloimpatiens sp. FM7315 TaxID=3298609 RepID=UPI00370B37F3
MDLLIQKIDKVFLFLVIYTIVFLCFFSTLTYTLPFVLGILFALLLQKPTKFLINKLKIKNWVASLIVTIVFFTIISIILIIGIASLTKESIELLKNIQIYFNNNYDKILDQFTKLEKNFKNLDPHIVSTVKDSVATNFSKAINLTLDITRKTLSLSLAFFSKIPYLIMVVLFTLLSTYFFTKDLTEVKTKFMNYIPENKSHRVYEIVNESKKMLGNYLASYLLIIFITFAQTLIGFLIFKVKYALILSVLCGIFDLLPILGIGAIYIPLIIIYLAAKNYFVAIGLLVLYVIVSIVRQIVEPKIVSSSLGLHPVAVLAAIFIGLKANGISGMFFSILLIVFYNIFKKVKLI